MKPLDKFTHAWPWPTFKVTGGHFFPSVTLLCLVNTLVWEWNELQSSNWKHRFLIWSPWTSLLMHDIDLFSRSSGVTFVYIFFHMLVNTLVWEQVELESTNSKHIFFIWRPWTSSLMHDIDLFLGSPGVNRLAIHCPSVHCLWTL